MNVQLTTTGRKSGVSLGPLRAMMEHEEFKKRLEIDPDFSINQLIPVIRRNGKLEVGEYCEWEHSGCRGLQFFCEPSTSVDLLTVCSLDSSKHEDESAVLVWQIPDIFIPDRSVSAIDLEKRVEVKQFNPFPPGRYHLFDLTAPRPGFEWKGDDLFDEGFVIDFPRGFSVVERYSVEREGDEVACLYRFRSELPQ